MEKATQSRRYESKRTYANEYSRSKFKKKDVPSIRDNRRRKREQKNTCIHTYEAMHHTMLLWRYQERNELNKFALQLDHDNLNYYGEEWYQ
jgi:hypothetical protein